MASLWQTLRKDFSITKKYLYFDHAAGGPVPRPVLETAQKYYQEHANEADFAWVKWINKREEVRARVAQFIGADPSEITFISSTSQGMNYVAELLGDQGAVQMSKSEFPSSTVPWLWRKTKVIWQEPESNGVLPVSKIKQAATSEVKTIVTSAVQYATGFRQDLQTLGKNKGNRFLVVNATQALGAFELNVEKMNIDFLMTNSYKWMLAGYGGGILYLRKKWLKKFRPQTVGWRSMIEPEARMDNRSMDLHPQALRYEIGCPSFPSIFAVGAAAEYFSQIGMTKISERILDLTGYLIEGLEKLGYEVTSPKKDAQRSGIVVFRHMQPKILWKKLLNEKVCVSPRGTGIRVAPHFYNTYDELDRFLKILVRLEKK